MIWIRTHGFDQRARAIADRHYTRQQVGARQFVPPGRRLVLVTPAYDALWVVSAPAFSRHAWPGAWLVTLYRNESPTLSSVLARTATDETLRLWGAPPVALLTFVDAAATARRRSRRSPPGACFVYAGWTPHGATVGPQGSGRGGPKIVLRAPSMVREEAAA